MIQDDKARVLSAKTDYPTTLMSQVVYTNMFHENLFATYKLTYQFYNVLQKRG